MAATDTDVIAGLTPALEEAFDTHLHRRRPWMAHQVVPPGAYDPVTVEDGTASALFVNLLTEDNLPYYSHSLLDMFGDDGVWGAWVRRWTAEEGQHSIVIRDWIRATGAIDLDQLETSRMHQVEGGQVPQPQSPLDTLAYVTFQEKATAVAHRNTGQALGDSLGRTVMQRVAGDETHHFRLYCSLVSAAMKQWPSAATQAIWRQLRRFMMPGQGIDDFDRHASAIRAADIFGPRQLHDEVFAPIVTDWELETVSGLDADGDRARTKIFRRLESVRRLF